MSNFSTLFAISFFCKNILHKSMDHKRVGIDLNRKYVLYGNDCEQNWQCIVFGKLAEYPANEPGIQYPEKLDPAVNDISWTGTASAGCLNWKCNERFFHLQQGGFYVVNNQNETKPKVPTFHVIMILVKFTLSKWRNLSFSFFCKRSKFMMKGLMYM